MVMMSMASRRILQRAAPPARALRTTTISMCMRLKSNASRAAAPSALGLKDASQGAAFSNNTKLILGYITFGVAAMATIARAKERPEDVEESARIFNMAKRAVVKDRRLFEAIGYPKTFERIATPDADAAQGELPASSVFEGTFKALGDNGTAIVTYKHRSPEAITTQATEGEAAAAAADVPIFEVLEVELQDGSRFSALESYVKNEDVKRQQKASSLGKKLFLPVLGGVVIGGISSFLLIRIVRNRPFYVHKLVLDHVNNSDAARKLLGHPITSDRKAYVGSLSDAMANYSVACKGPKGEGTLIVKAYKKEPETSGAADAAAKSATVMATPGTDWKFSTLVLSVKRNELRKEKEKTAKTVDLLATLKGDKL